MEAPVRKVDVRAVDLFCGAGGLSHGLIKAGVNVTAGFDLDPDCKYPFEKNNRAKFFEADVASLAASDVARHLAGGTHSLLAGCAPCQPFSTYSRSGRSRKRADDWQLVRSFGDLVQRLQPDMVSMENVPQLADHEVFVEFNEMLSGYHVAHQVVECAEVGIPQSRRRLVLVASRLGPVSLDIRSSRKIRTVREVIGDLPKLEAGGCDERDPLHVASSLSPLNMRRIKASRPGGTWRDWDAELLATCHTRDSGATYPSVYGRMEWDSVAPTITTQCFGYGNGRFGHPEQDRAISLREAAMLQTFPRGYEFVRPGEPVRFNKLGRLIGNAVPVGLGKVVGRAVVRHAEAHAAAGGASGKVAS